MQLSGFFTHFTKNLFEVLSEPPFQKKEHLSKSPECDSKVARPADITDNQCHDVGVEFSSNCCEYRTIEKCLHQNAVRELICYGLGRFSSCLIARFQLAFLLLLRDMLQVQCYVYDPLFSDTEKLLLDKMKLLVLHENEEGKRKISGKPTLFYMPHCGKPLYNNVLWANWEPGELDKLVILGNSFQHMADSIPSRLLCQKAPFVLKILPYVLEKPVENSFRYTDIFNDTSVHVFPSQSCDIYPADFWTRGPEPVYSDDEIILASNAEDKS